MNQHNAPRRRFVILAVSACLTGMLSAPIVLGGLWLALTVTP